MSQNLQPHPPPSYNVVLGWNFSFNIEWGRRGLRILHEQLICENNFLNTFVLDCSFMKYAHKVTCIQTHWKGTDLHTDQKSGEQ